MASDIDISNLALARLGDDATVSNLTPPEGSAQAEHCARWFPIARDSLLEQHDWNFATRRATLATVTMPTGVTEWQYAYALPNNCIKMVAVLPPNSTSDSVGVSAYYNNVAADSGAYMPQQTGYATQEFVIETDVDGSLILLTNQAGAFAIYTQRITDTTKFSPLFVDTLAAYGASYLAGPVLKGETGRAEAKAWMQIAMALLGKAASSDANQRFSQAQPSTSWISNR